MTIESLRRGTEGELEALERERRRIDAQLRTPGSRTIEAMLRDERRWVERRKRALERVQVSSRATLRWGSVACRCHVRDVSAHGACVEADVHPRVDEAVRIELTDLSGGPTLDAVVRHVTGRRIGLEFAPRGAEARAAAAELALRFSAEPR